MPPPDPAEESLRTYRSMRDFARTPEPDGSRAAEAGNRFVVQEHHATALHWDFRLERDGVLVSWSVPKGIPEDPKVNHLAVHTEDHPLDYVDFEGDIPAGSYGAGTVTVWDSGTYECEKFRDREVMVTLHGRRVQGKYVLFQTDGRNWMMHRMDPPQDPTREPMPGRVAPMLAKLSDLPKDDARYAFEVKWDGIRAIAFVDGGRVRLQSRNLLDVTKQYPELRGLGEQLGSRSAVLDGEIVAFDDEGRPSFQRLQNRMGLANPNDVRRRMRDSPVVYMLFDVLYLEGHSTMPRPYAERRKLLEDLALEGDHWQTPAYHAGDGKMMQDSSRARGLEGLVAKRLDSPYEPGSRGASWLKIKNHARQELVIGGWTPGAGGRQGSLGALLLGYYDRTAAEAESAGEPQRFIFAGKVGTGFSDRMLADLLDRLRRAEREASPFDLGVPEPGSRFVEPELVADVEFTEWTRAGTLRHPSFLGLRPDKVPGDVVLETKSDPAEAPSGVVGKPGVGRRKAGPIRKAATPQDEPATSRERAADLEVDPGHANGASAGPRARAGTRAKEGEATPVQVEGRQLTLTNLSKVLYPSGFTKAEVIDYYMRIAPPMLPHLKGRPMTLKRYPNGSDAGHFYEKECPSHRPSWVATGPIHSNRNGKPINYCLVNDLPTLAWLANLASLELHPLLAVYPEVHQPTSVVFDLDPGPPAALLECCAVALELRDLFAALGLQCFPKTSGSKGMQVYLPLNVETSYDETKSFALAVAELVQRRLPGRVVTNMSKAARPGKVFVDWSQNDEHKTTIAVYSLRARERPTVSTPLHWSEVERAVDRGDAASLAFEAGTVLERVAKDGDLFAPLLTLRQPLPGLSG